MPLGSNIYATTDLEMTSKDVELLRRHLIDSLGVDCVSDFNGGLLRISKEQYNVIPDDIPKAATIIEVNLETAYYGKGYERGCWPEIAATLEFLRHRIPNSQVWYGDDCSDNMEEMTKVRLDEYWNYWSCNGYRPYYNKNKKAEQPPGT